MAVQVHFLLGPAGSGKTHRCLAEIRNALSDAPEGAPLILLAPKQATFQLERQLLADDALPGYARLQILSFERLADFVLDTLRSAPSELLGEEGRLMVLRALLARHRDELKLFRATARLPGFARQLSAQLREFQRYQVSAAKLERFARETGLRAELRDKLHDLALLLRAYTAWLDEHRLKDGDGLLDLATDALMTESQAATTGSNAPDHSPLRIGGLWLDGFAEMTPQELKLLTAVLPRCDDATLAFCLDAAPAGPNAPERSWLSMWSVIERTFRDCHSRLEGRNDCALTIETLQRDTQCSRFSLPELAHLERSWSAPEPFPGKAHDTESIRVIACDDPDAEATLAAREMVRFARGGGRYREAAVIVRQLDPYHAALERAFTRFGIPFFIDHRESIAYHPLAELTRSTLRTIAFDWSHEDWFAALKTGLAPASESALDWLENEALARGWKGRAWREPLRADCPEQQAQLEQIRRKLIPPFETLAARLTARPEPNGSELATFIREFWDDLDVQRQLESWAAQPALRPDGRGSNSIHVTTWVQMNAWLDNLALAFAAETLPLREWLPILEAGLANLTIGVVPPALDQVLIGAIDRSRNPDLKLALVLGLNESLFPAPPAGEIILTEPERNELSARLELRLGPDLRQRLARERYYGYIACTRARQKLVLSFSERNAAGQTLNPSAFVAHLRRLFPNLPIDTFSANSRWHDCEHLAEITPAILRGELAAPERLTLHPAIGPILSKWQDWKSAPVPERLALSPAAARALYGVELNTSVSALERFAACPFQYFANHGLRADERKLFEPDSRQTGTFQHEILRQFHAQLAAEKKRWRDIPVAEARERIGRIGADLAVTFKDGLFQSDGKSHFLAATLIERLQDFIEVIIGWMSQYTLDPCVGELSFGLKDSALPAWRIDLGDGTALLLRGKIDRVDVCRVNGSALAVIMDYKSRALKPDPVLLEHGLELQLLSYLAALRNLEGAGALLGAGSLLPAGVFYVPLRGNAPAGNTRRAVLEEESKTVQNFYRHSGRFDAAALPHLDNRGETTGTQFRYALKKDGGFKANGNDALPSEEFAALLDKIESDLRRHGRDIFAGVAKAAPYRKGAERACTLCACATVCRFDPWVNPFNVLRKTP